MKPKYKCDKCHKVKRTCALADYKGKSLCWDCRPHKLKVIPKPMRGLIKLATPRRVVIKKR